MTIISFINRKGGVAKTTLCVNIAGFLAANFGKKVLVIDLDPQASASTWLMTPDRYVNEVANAVDNPKNTCYQLFRDALYEEENYFSEDISIIKGVARNPRTNIPIQNLDLMPSDVKLDDLDKEVASNFSDVKPSILYEVLYSKSSSSGSTKPLVKQYDCILIDCPPDMAIGTQNAIYTSDAFVIPMIEDQLSYQGFPELIHTIKHTQILAKKRRRDHYSPYCGGIIISHARKKPTTSNTKILKKIKDTLDDYKSEGLISPLAKIFKAKIRYLTGIPDIQVDGKILVHANTKTPSKGDFEALTVEFLETFKCGRGKSARR